MPHLPALAKINDLLQKRPEEIKQAKANGRQVVGYFCSYIPEEIIWASRMIPLRLCRAGNNQAVSVGATYLSSNSCPFACSCVGLRKDSREGYFKLIDYVIDAPACLQMRRVLEVWEKYFEVKVLTLALPRQFYSAKGQAYFAQAIERLSCELADGNAISLDQTRLAGSVELFNHIRQKQRWLYEGLKDDSFPLNWRQVLSVIRAGLILDREQYLQLLHELVEQLKAAPVNNTATQKTRLLLAGAMLAPGDDKLMNILTDLNGELVMDELCTGSRGIYVDIEEPTIAAIAKRYLSNVPCGSLPYPELEGDPRHKHIKRLLSEYRIQGVIYYTLRFCDAYNFKAGHLRQLVTDAGCSFLHISSDYSNADVGQILTRVEAFLESIQHRL